MSDARFHRQVQLREPFQEHTVTVDTEPPMRTWIRVREALLAVGNTSAGSLEEAIQPVLDAIAPMVVAHDLVDVETGEPLELRFEAMSPGQLREVIRAIQTVVMPETMEPAPGESADPLPPGPRPRRPAKRSPSR